jgi:alpha-1,3-rhamnosyltransferase
MLNTLVTVGIATYNSAKFIEETLESVKTQSYPSIELLVSDDCSKDNTIEVVENWLSLNKQSFVAVKLLKVDTNTGVSANCNRIFNNATGIFVKLLAGDDILLNTCIEDNMGYINKFPNTKVVFSQVGIFQDVYKPNHFSRIKPTEVPNNLMTPDFDAKKQFETLLEGDRITYTPSVFFERQVVISLGGFDEEFRLVEDYPMWLKLTSSGVRLSYFNKVTVGYRVHGMAANNVGGDYLFPPSKVYNYGVRAKYVFPHLSLFQRLSEKYENRIVKLFNNLGLNNKSYKFLFNLFSRYCNPFWLVNRVFGL